MADTWRENAIVQAIQIIADKKIAQAGYDKTYKGIVNRVLDKTSGKYEIKYQDSLVEAYATSSEVYYEEGQQVSFLVPGNDWDRVKTIVGGIENTALTYNQIQQISEKYTKIGPSAVNGRYELSSYDYKYVDITKNLGINQQTIQNYVKNGNGLVLGMNVQTNLASSQVGGEYGLVFNLRFKDNVTGAAAVRQYVVNSKDVIGNPYSLTRQTPVERLFENIDLESLEGIQSVYVYCEKFPQDQTKTDIKDIIISNIRFNGVDVLTQNDLSGYSVHIDYSQTGNILKPEEKSQTGEVISDKISTVTLKGILKVKGKTISSDVNYYWFRQNGMVLRGHQKYSNYGGDGWECLNYFANGKAVPFIENSISFTSEYGSENPVSAVDKNTRIKCVAVFEYKNTEGFSNVLNKNITTDVYIDSNEKRQGVNDNKVDYYLDAGHPTLTCIVSPEGDYNYHWTVVPARGKAESRESSQNNRNLYINSKAEWNRVENYANSLAATDAEAYIHNDENAADEESQYHKYYNPDSPRFAEYTNAKNNFEKVQFAPYVFKNVYYNFPINTISNYTKIICTITQQDSQTGKDDYKGSASITLYNHMEVPDTYNLNIENGTQVFQYDDKGNSPASPQLEKPLEIHPLTFTLIDNEGNQVSYDQVINNGYVEWMIPKNNTLLISQGNDQSKKINYDTATGTDRALAADFDIYKNIPSFSYTIAPVYDSKLTNNYIRLDIKYKDMLFSAYTDFTFPKDGDPGTNGTDYVVKLSPSTSTDRVYISNKIPDVLFDDDGNTVDNLKFQVYNNSRKVENASPSLWTCPPKGTLEDNVRGNAYININYDIQNPQECFVEAIEPEIDHDVLTDKPINIIRAHYKNGDLNQYAEYPICYNYLVSNSGYRFKIKPKTGFKYAVYQEDGTSPQYDNTLPFEVIVELRDNDTGYYIIQDSGLTYTWQTIGNIELDTNRNTGLNDNQRYYKPKNTFDGSDLTSAIVVKIQKDNENNDDIGYIHIPIYMIINRYGHSALNNWDGNSIQLGQDEDGNSTGTILAPQIGAGSKDNQNRFTGIFMGDVKDNSGNEDIGLMGYHQGQRSIFLDAQTGKAEFGKQNAAKIVLDPSQKINGKDTAFIYSNNFLIDDVEESGVIRQGYISRQGNLMEGSSYYNYQKESGNGGMMIDLTSPQIAFANGKFNISSTGGLHSQAGDIAGWKITDTQLFKKVQPANPSSSSSSTTGDQTGMRSAGNPAFYAYKITKTMDENGNITTSTDKNFYVNHNGYLSATTGKIGPWSLTPSALTNGKVGLGSTVVNNFSYHYNGASTSKNISDVKIWSNNNFAVDNSGKLWANSAQIGPWEVDNSKFTNGNVGLGAKIFSNKNPFTNGAISARFWAAASTADADLNFAVDNTGNLYSKAGKIGGWNIENDRLWAVNNDNGNGIRLYANGSMMGGSTATPSSWAINSDGSSSFRNINAQTGKIGKCTINEDSISGSNTNTGYNWNIKSDGTASFNKINASGGEIGGMTITSSRVQGTGGWYITNSQAYFPGLIVDSNGIHSGGSGGISGNGGSWSMPGGSAPSWNYGGKTMTPIAAKLWDTLALKTSESGSGNAIDIFTGTVHKYTVLKSSTDLKATSHTGSISIPTESGTITRNYTYYTYELDKETAQVYTGSAYYYLNGGKIVTGWSTCKKQDVQIMASTITEPEVKED